MKKFSRFQKWALIVLALYILFVSAFIWLQRDQEKNYYQKREERAKRVREIETLKLLASEPYLWKSAMRCRANLFQARPSPKKCMPLSFSWVREAESIPKEAMITRPGRPCLVCHASEQKSMVLWKFKEPLPPPPRTDAWIWLMIPIPLLGLFVLWRAKEEAETIEAIVMGQFVPEKIAKSKSRKKYKNLFKAAEIHPSYIRFSVDRSRATSILELEIFLTGHQESDDSLPTGKNLIVLMKTTLKELWPDLGAMSAKIPEGAIAVEHEAVEVAEFIKKNREQQYESKKGIWKKQGREYSFFLFVPRSSVTPEENT